MKANIDKLKIRGRVLRGIRLFFDEQGFTEVEVPSLVPQPSTEPYLEVFATKLKTADGQQLPAFLTTSPEYGIKKLLAAGIGSCYTITKSFRNGEGIGSFHNHEFSILEWYRTPGDYQDVMNDTQNLIRFLVKDLGQDPKNFVYQGQKIDLASPWLRLSIPAAFEKFLGISKAKLLDQKFLQQLVLEKELTAQTDLSYDDLFQILMTNLIEPSLSKTQPTFLYDYPISQAALAQPKADDPDLAERFEIYIAGVELGNAFSELRDPDEQLKRMQADLDLRQSLGKTAYGLDQDLVVAIKKGIPPTGGIAMGIDRLVMLLTDSVDISEVVAFSTRELFHLSA